MFWPVPKLVSLHKNEKGEVSGTWSNWGSDFFGPLVEVERAGNKLISLKEKKGMERWKAMLC